MDLNNIVEIIKNHAPMLVQYILMALGALVILGRAYIYITPTQDDDKWWASMEEKPVIGMLLKVLVSFSPIGRKEVDESGKPEA